MLVVRAGLRHGGGAMMMRGDVVEAVMRANVVGGLGMGGGLAGHGGGDGDGESKNPVAGSWR